ncbi:hypothetical protein [Rhodococcus tukisamuensis]|uniref:Dehydratase n=1 Tax=Rhodococcus tukisamuensis TaxID=168276 RepID=A0A1G7DQV2_9NOCA|nr:hypothetical protein [Rhodococcus tukisamuensis]SDE53550.1 hypothetical protein SAMN05444580_12037 [Rhodococcus tukisamuensis]
MFRSTMRRVASAVFASAMLAGGLAVGSGTAAANQDTTSGPAVSKSFENIDVLKGAAGQPGTTLYVAPGEEFTIHNSFRVQDGDERILTRITDHAPAGLEYVPGSAKLAIVGGDPNVPYLSYEVIPTTPEVGSGTVSVVAPGAGWSVAPGAGHGWIEFRVTYRVPQSAQIGAVFDTGVTFDVAGHEGGLGWNPIGLSVAIAAGSGSSDGFGSSGQ